MNERDLDPVLAWRNHADVRRCMFSQREISHAEHARWFARSSRDSNRCLLIFEIDATPLGFVGFHRISDGGTADWGFYTAPDAPKGTGSALGKAALRYAFEDLAFHKLCGQALAYNDRSIRLHQKLGFQREGVLRLQYFDGNLYHDVVCFGLLASEWRRSG